MDTSKIDSLINAIAEDTERKIKEHSARCEGEDSDRAKALAELISARAKLN